MIRMMNSKPFFLASAILTFAIYTGLAAEPAEFVAWSAEPGFEPPKIAMSFRNDDGTAVDWSQTNKRQWHDSTDAATLGWAVELLCDGIERMTGRRPEVVNSEDQTRGFVLTTLDRAGDDIRNDAEVQAALRNTGDDRYNDREAFFIRSEAERLLIVANTIEGLVVAVPELLESVGYEILGMGPNWIHVPKEHRSRLAFAIETAGRPGYYFRGLSATSGQSYGVGTILDRSLLSDPADETVDASYRRWQIGRRLKTRSMPAFPGHALQGYHRAAIEMMRETGNTAGFLAKVEIGRDRDRPSLDDKPQRRLWINSDPDGDPAHGKVFVARKGEWTEGNLASLPANLDLSVPAVRNLVLERFKQQSEKFFASSPDEIFIFGTDPEDGGGYSDLANQLHDPDWYPNYLAEAGIEFGRPYTLHGFKGLDQPRETWDSTAPSDIVYGFNNWLLWEYDRWLESRPESERKTASGQSKKEAVRCSFYCYNYHDVPPNFNPDPRIRVMIAGYPKNRGRGKWKAFASQTDLAQAFAVMLPREPSGDYWILSLSYFSDRSIEGLKPRWDASPKALTTRLHEHYDAGFRALSVETDFNFGRMGLGYYLLSQMLWKPGLTEDELHAIRDRWLQRAFGSGWKAMKDYYDFLLPENYPVNSPHAWSQAIRFIEAADQKIDPSREPDRQRRLDDLKQFWYYYYLVDSGEDKANSEAMRELFWKGQMSYMNATHMIARSIFGTSKTAEAAKDLVGTRAHFTPKETAAWWAKILDRWPIVPVSRFAEATLANGRPASEVDLNDLVAVEEFGLEPCRQAFLYNSGYMTAPTFLCRAAQAGGEIGFQLYWPADPTDKDRYYIARDVPWGASRWNAAAQTWDEVADRTMTVQPSEKIHIPGSKRENHHLAAVRMKAPLAGTYRFEIGRGGNLSFLADLSWNPADNTHSGGRSLTFDCNAIGLTQSPTYIYLPKGVKSLDLEVWDAYNRKFVTLYKTTSPTRAGISRKVDISARKTHRIALEADETGNIAEISGNGFAFPYLYSVPMLWAKSPSQLLVSRAIAQADGLTIR